MNLRVNGEKDRTASGKRVSQLGKSVGEGDADRLTLLRNFAQWVRAV